MLTPRLCVWDSCEWPSGRHCCWCLRSPLQTTPERARTMTTRGAVAVSPDAAVFVDGATIACDGALCETRTGTTCDLAGVSPGRISPSSAGPFAIVGALAFA